MRGMSALVPSEEILDYRGVNVTNTAPFAPRDGAGALVFTDTYIPRCQIAAFCRTLMIGYPCCTQRYPRSTQEGSMGWEGTHW